MNLAQHRRSAGTRGAARGPAELRAHPDAPYAAVVCHPHPLFGGTMHNKVVYHAMKTLQPSACRCCASTFAAPG